MDGVHIRCSEVQCGDLAQFSDVMCDKDAKWRCSLAVVDHGGSLSGERRSDDVLMMSLASVYRLPPAYRDARRPTRG